VGVRGGERRVDGRCGLGLCVEFCKVEVLSMGTQPVRHEDTWIRPCQLSIKLYAQQVDADRDVGVEEAMHVHCHRKQCCLRKIFVFFQRQQGVVEVAVQ